VFDAKGKTFRDDLYPDYKATRKSMPEDLALQIEPIHEAVRAWAGRSDGRGHRGRRRDRYALGPGRRRRTDTIVSTGDKDMAQLVNEHVTLVNTMSNEVLDIAGVTAKFGVPPERIVDYLS
jgi:DNA polymerase-1